MTHQNYLDAKRFVDRTASEMWGKTAAEGANGHKRSLWTLILSTLGL